jgi:hypothetical protein
MPVKSFQVSAPARKTQIGLLWLKYAQNMLDIVVRGMGFEFPPLMATSPMAPADPSFFFSGKTSHALDDYSERITHAKSAVAHAG